MWSHTEEFKVLEASKGRLGQKSDMKNKIQKMFKGLQGRAAIETVSRRETVALTERSQDDHLVEAGQA